jgi:hypothetical protein
MASDILGLFTTPQQYEQQRQAAMEAQALQTAQLTPMQQGQYGIALGAQQLGRAIGGALGGVDPQLQKITQRQQLIGMIDPNNPDSYAQAINAALQTGDQEAAFLLRNEMMRVKQQAQEQQLSQLKTEDYLTQRGLGMQQRGMEARASSIASGIDPDTGERTKPLVDPTTQTFNQDVANILVSQYGQIGANLIKQRIEGLQGIESLQTKQLEQRALKVARGINPDTGEQSTPLIDPTTNQVNQSVANSLINNYGQAGANIVKQAIEGTTSIESLQIQQLAKSLFNADGTRNPYVEKQLSTTVAGRAILKSLAPETKELKKGEKLVERQPDGTWKIITPEGLPTQTASSDNAIQALIAGNAIHPTILPYATQLAKNFANLDFEDQNVLMEKLTKLNNDAQKYASEKNARDQSRETNNALKELNLELARLKIKKAQDDQQKAADGKEIKLADATKLADKAGMVDKLSDLTTSFKPEFAGYVTNSAGDIDVWAAGKSNEPNRIALFQWWQSYQDHVNKVRNDLFGAALTAPEKAEFDKAMVTKGMNPAQAKANLDRQAEIAKKAYDKLDNVLRVQGYSKAALDALKPSSSLPPLSNFIVQGNNTNPSNVTGGRR